MGNCLSCLHFAALALGVLWWYWAGKKQPVEVHGYTHPRFEKIRGMFSDMIQSDREGATLAVLHKGTLVVNLYGGYANRESGKMWTRDTMAVAYSTTKIWAGLTAAILASRGLLQYDWKVSTFWPQFGQHGKSDITVRDVLDHKAGLVSFGREFGLEDAKQEQVISSLIEEARPLWVPGTRRGYHALTYGFLVDEIIKRLHPQNKTVSQIYREEVWSEGITFSIGRPSLNHSSIASISNPSLRESVIAHLRKPIRLLTSIWSHVQHNGLAMTSANYPYFLGIMRTDTIPYNDPAITELPLISCMGIGTAEGFAKAVHEVFKKHLISDSVWNLLSSPTTSEEDIVLSCIKSFGHGFTYEPHPVHEGKWIIRIVGNGLQIIDVDKKDEIIIVMLRNGLRAGDSGAAEYERISRTIFQIIETNR